MDHYLIEHCAPTLASIKTANLFRVSFDTQKNLFAYAFMSTLL